MIKLEIVQRVLRAKSDQELRQSIWIGKWQVPRELIDAEQKRRKAARAYSELQAERGEI
jgi:hypothetical protein